MLRVQQEYLYMTGKQPEPLRNAAVKFDDNGKP